MNLVQFQAVSLHLGHEQIFDQIDLLINKQDHLGLLGRNGEGKSTLLKLLGQTIEADAGKCVFQKNINIKTLPQSVPENLSGPVIHVVAEGLGKIGHNLVEYHKLSKQNELSSTALDKLAQLQQIIDDNDGWHLYSKMQTVLSKLQLPPHDEISYLSGGMKRRVLLAQALLTEPDLLLLDEPTNHLDIDSILWLERFLKSYPSAFILVTHDRSFLQATTDAILEIDRGKLHRFNGDYQYYLKEKSSQLAAADKANAEFDKKLAQEEKWIRQGIKARRTRNEGRVRALKALRKERQQRRDLKGTMSLGKTPLDLSSKIIFKIKKVSYAITNRDIIDNFSCLITRQDKIGIIGPNGCGKTTMLKLILGELKPTSGEIKTGAQIKVAYFDQMKDQIDEQKSAIDNVGQGSLSIEAFGKTQHIISYMKSFLFTPERARSPVKYLSGGERSRLLLARLFTQNANVLVLDEPTNDLDIESMEILESFLVEYPGTVLIVSHDRTFLENVVTSSWVYQGKGSFKEFIGAQTNYQIDPGSPDQSKLKKQPKAEHDKNVADKVASESPRKKLTYNEQRELKALPEKIDQLEEAIAAVQQTLSDPSTYQSNDADLSLVHQKLNTLETELESTYKRWEQLESLK